MKKLVRTAWFEQSTCVICGAITATISILVFGESWLALFLGFFPGMVGGVFVWDYFGKNGELAPHNGGSGSDTGQGSQKHEI